MEDTKMGKDLKKPVTMIAVRCVVERSCRVGDVNPERQLLKSLRKFVCRIREADHEGGIW